MRSLWLAVFLLFAPIVAHAQSTPSPVSTWCASSAAGPWAPCSSAGGTPSSPSVTTQAPITYAAPGTTVAVSTASTSVISAGVYTKFFTVCTEQADVGNVWLNVSGGAAVVNSGIYVPAAGGCVSIPPPTAAVTGISDSGTSHLTIQGG